MGFLDFLFHVASKSVEIGERQQQSFQERAEREIRNYEKKVNVYAKDHPNTEKVKEARKQIESARQKIEPSSAHRRTDSEIENDSSETNLLPTDFQIKTEVPLKDALRTANSEPGVYILYLNGQVMKCGRAVYKQGIHWRFTQYYNLNYDAKAQKGDLWAINNENRDDVIVSWQCCPASKCSELEYKLFKKYGKGPWGLRAPKSCHSDSWDLLI